MKVIGIDPGNEQSAWAHVRDGAVIGTCNAVRNGELVQALRDGYFATLDVDFLAIEMIASYGMPVGREVFETCLWIGRFMEAWHARGGRAQLVYRREVKLYLCESNRATDANVRAALLDRYGPGREKAVGTKRAPGPLYEVKGDAWQALAVALTAAKAPAPVRTCVIGGIPAEEIPF